MLPNLLPSSLLVVMTAVRGPSCPPGRLAFLSLSQPPVPLPNPPDMLQLVSLPESHTHHMVLPVSSALLTCDLRDSWGRLFFRLQLLPPHVPSTLCPRSNRPPNCCHRVWWSRHCHTSERETPYLTRSSLSPLLSRNLFPFFKTCFIYHLLHKARYDSSLGESRSPSQPRSVMQPLKALSYHTPITRLCVVRSPSSELVHRGVLKVPE